jgi:predicted tellurium resistance membrane protein TerC
MKTIFKTAGRYFYECVKAVVLAATILAGVFLAVVVPISILFLPLYLGYSWWWLLATGPFVLFVICVIAAWMNKTKQYDGEYDDQFLPK